MDTSFIPYLLMVVMVVSNTVIIFLFSKKRSALDLSLPENVAQSKRLRLAITMLYLQMVVFTAFIWLVLAPLLQRMH